MRASTQTALLLCIVLFLVIQLNSVERFSHQPWISSPESPTTIPPTPPAHETTPRQPRLGDGCYHIFLDVGSNIGLHARFLYEPHHYPDSTSSVEAFAQQFGTDRDNRDFCIFAFEPNPQFEQRHLDLAAAYKQMGWRYHPILAGASTNDGNMTFYHSFMVDTESAHKELGFSAVTPKTLYGQDSKSKVVPTIRLATWIIREIHDRIIPTTTHSPKTMERNAQPKVVMKLDIEGIEYKVFPDLIVTGALCNTIDFLMGEFHYGPGNHNMYPMKLTSDGKHILKHRKEGQALANELLRLVDIAENCKTEISLRDDESYVTDPVELPK